MAPETIRIGPLGVRFLVEGTDSDGSVAIFELVVPSRSGMPVAHSHDGYEETLYGLEGVTTWTVQGVEIELGAGDALCIPRGAVHAFENRGEADAKALCAITPGVLGPDFFLEAGAVLADAAGGPPDPVRLGEVMRRHGLTPAPPPG